MEKVEEDAAIWGRALLSEVIAVLEILTEKAPDGEDKASAFLLTKELYTLVGCSNEGEFVEKSETVRKLVAPADFKSSLPYMANVYFKAIKRLKKTNKLKGYIEAYARSLMFDLSPYGITEAEISIVKRNIDSLENFSSTLLGYYRASDKKAEIEESTGLNEKKFEKKLLASEIRLSTLRVVCLILNLKFAYRTMNHAGQELSVH